MSAAYTLIGDEERSRKIFNEGLDIAKGIQDAYISYSDETFTGIASAYAKNRQFEKSIETINSIKSMHWKELAVLNVLSVYINFGKFDEALELTDEIDEEYVKEKILSEISISFAKNFQFDKALEMLEGVKDINLKTQVIVEIALDYDKIGRKDLSKDILSQYLDLIDKDKKINELTKSEVFGYIAQSLVETGQFEKAIELTETISNSLLKDKPLSEISSSLAKSCQFEKAIEVLSSIKQKYILIYALRDLGMIFNEYNMTPSAEIEKQLHGMMLNIID